MLPHFLLLFLHFLLNIAVRFKGIYFQNFYLCVWGLGMLVASIYLINNDNSGTWIMMKDIETLRKTFITLFIKSYCTRQLNFSAKKRQLPLMNLGKYVKLYLNSYLPSTLPGSIIVKTGFMQDYKGYILVQAKIIIETSGFFLHRD